MPAPSSTGDRRRQADLDALRASWEGLAREDALWAVLSDPRFSGGRWDVDEFLETGRGEVAALLADVEAVRPGFAPRDVLDFGCGVGRLTQALAERVPGRVTGVDIAAPMLDRARAMNRHGDRVDYVLNAAEDLAVVPNASVDLVVSQMVLQHIRTELALGYLAEFARVLRPGGALWAMVPARPGRTPHGLAYRLVPRGLIHALKARRDASVMEMHAIPTHRVTTTLEAAGLRVDAVLRSDAAGPHWDARAYVASRPA